MQKKFKNRLNKLNNMFLRAEKLQTVENIGKNYFTFKKYDSKAMRNERKNNSKESKSLVSEGQEGENFSFFSYENCVEHEHFIIDSEATNQIIKRENSFANRDESFSGIIQNADKTHSSILGKGFVEFFTKNSKEEVNKIDLRGALLVRYNSKNLISAPKLREQVVDVSFGEKLEINFTEVLFPFEAEIGLFVWRMSLVLIKIALMLTVYRCGIKKIGHNKIFDLKRLPELFEGM